MSLNGGITIGYNKSDGLHNEMTDLDNINSLIDVFLEERGLNYIAIKEFSLFLKEKGVSYSTDGPALRRLLRKGKIPNAEQPGGKGTRWYIRHSKYNELPKPKVNNVIGLAPVVNDDSEILILGTLPGADSLRKGEYYSNPGNQLWKILAYIFNRPTPLSYHDKTNFLRNNKIALWDVLKSADREGSLDKKIKNPVPNDVLGFLNEHTSIRTIVLNGSKATEMFRKFIDLHRLNPDIQVFHLPNTSSSNRSTLNEKKKEWSAILR